MNGLQQDRRNHEKRKSRPSPIKQATRSRPLRSQQANAGIKPGKLSFTDVRSYQKARKALKDILKGKLLVERGSSHDLPAKTQLDCEFVADCMVASAKDSTLPGDPADRALREFEHMRTQGKFKSDVLNLTLHRDDLPF